MKKKFFSKFIPVLTVLLFTIQAAFAGNIMAFTVGEERELGEKLLYTVRSSFPIIGDPDLQQYISRLGREVLDVAGIQFFDYRFYIVESDQFNAFAAPSGLIFFYSKLIESMNSEDELVSVLAHEIGHVVKRHLASRMEKSTKINLASLGIALAAIALGGGSAGAQAIVTGSLAAGQSAQLYFSRQDEMEADLLAYNWMKKLHRNPEGQRDMLKTMRRITRYRSGQIPQYLLTHPNPEARLDYVESLLNSESGPLFQKQEEKDFEFLRFKYRIMTKAGGNKAERLYFGNRINDSSSSDFQKTMAEYGLALLDREEKNYQKCIQRLDRVIEKIKDKPLLHIDKGIILAEMGRLEEARKILRAEVRNNPFDMYATFYLAKVLYKIGELETAKQLFLDVSYDLPEYSQVYFEIGKIMAETGAKEESRFYLGKYYLYEGKLELAASNFREVKRKAGDDDTLREESEEFLELIKRLKKG